MNENDASRNDPAQAAPPTEADGNGAGTRKRVDFGAALRDLQAPEKMLAAAALAVIVGFIVLGSWSALFHSWFLTCAFVGAVGSLALIGLDVFGVRVLQPKARTWLVVALALLPALGFVIDQLGRPSMALMLAGSIAMGLAGVRITSREKILS